MSPAKRKSAKKKTTRKRPKAKRPEAVPSGRKSAKKKTTARKRTRKRKKAQAAKRNPALLTPSEMAKLLAVPQASVDAHVKAGAPTDAEGRLHLVHYAAWLSRQSRDTHQSH